MKRILIAGALACALAAPASAARQVYLKDGGIIQARSVWHSQGRVHVLVNRDTLAEFNPNEIDMKRTFPKRKRPKVKKPAAAVGFQTATPASADAAVQQKPGDNKLSVSLPSLPSLPQTSPPSLGGKDEGSIRKHKKEMAEKIGE